MTKLVKKKWMFWEEDATAYCEVMKSFLIDNKMDSVKLQSISSKGYAEMFTDYITTKNEEIADSWLLFGCDEQEFATKLLDAMKRDVPPRNWLNIVEAAIHENGDIARYLKSVLEKEAIVEINEDSVKSVLSALRKEKSMTHSEIGYVREMIKRAIDRKWLVHYGADTDSEAPKS